MTDRTRGVLVGLALVVGLVVFVPLGITWVYVFSVAEENGYGLLGPTLLGGAVGLAAGFGPLVGALLHGSRKGVWTALVLVLSGMGVTLWYLTTT